MTQPAVVGISNWRGGDTQGVHLALLGPGDPIVCLEMPATELRGSRGGYAARYARSSPK